MCPGHDHIRQDCGGPDTGHGNTGFTHHGQYDCTPAHAHCWRRAVRNQTPRFDATTVRYRDAMIESGGADALAQVLELHREQLVTVRQALDVIYALARDDGMSVVDVAVFCASSVTLCHAVSRCTSNAQSRCEHSWAIMMSFTTLCYCTDTTWRTRTA